MRLALIGTGRWGRHYLETIARISPYQTHTITATDDVYKDRFDGIIVASPASTHYSIASSALSAGVPVLIEKPAALSSRETEDLRSLARETRTLAMVAHQHLHAPAFVELYRRLAPIEIAEIMCEAGGDGPVRTDCSVLWDWAPHDLAMVFTILGLDMPILDVQVERKEALRHGESWRWSMRVGDLFPVPVSIQISNVLDEKRRYLRVCHKQRGDFVYDDRLSHPEKLAINGDPIKISDDLPLDRLLDSFIAKIEAEEWDVPDLDLAIKIARTIEDVERAAPRVHIVYTSP